MQIINSKVFVARIAMADALFLYAKHRIRNTCTEGEGIWRGVAELPDEASFRHGRVQPSPFHLQCGFIS